MQFIQIILVIAAFFIVAYIAQTIWEAILFGIIIPIFPYALGGVIIYGIYSVFFKPAK